MTRIAENRPWIQRGAGRPRAVCLWLLAGIMALQVVRPSAGQSSGWETEASIWQTASGLCVSGCVQTRGLTLDGSGPVNPFIRQPGPSVLAESGQPVDRSLLLWLNARNNRVFVATMRAADVSFYPLVFGSVPVYWAATLVSEDVLNSDAIGYSIGWAATAGSTLVLKRLIGRERPYVSESNLIIRYTQAELEELGASSSMPSGHASMSVFVASFLAMQYDTPASYSLGGFWASSVAFSRIWNGVHFPSDIAAGAILGFGTSLLVRHFQ